MEPREVEAIDQRSDRPTKGLRPWISDEQESLKGSDRESERQALDSLWNDFRELDALVELFQGTVDGQYLLAEATRRAFIGGRAGTGKSHLLARIAELAIAEGRPVVLILGQQLRKQSLWPQILQTLQLPNISPDEFLGALDAAAESAGIRSLILIDAINEGSGASLWRDHIASFLAQIRQYPSLACVFTCRSEYVDYLIPPGLLADLVRFEIHGFETAQEQDNAARIYLDKRGITRPATPWLAPEFVNPLFLRSCCNALNMEGQTEFPRGLMGTKAIFAFFLNSVARHLGAGRDGTDDLARPTKATLRELASSMALERKDHLIRDKVEEIAERRFKLFTPPATMSWLEVLQRNGLVRFDPDPTINPLDPLSEPSDVVRFSFQRFQDHLMAEALLSTVQDIKTALVDAASLGFIHDGHKLFGKWQGLIEALSTQVPEKFRIELVDALPGNSDNWWRQWHIIDAFAESIRWRDRHAFTERTLQLFNRISGTRLDRWWLLIELSASANHPWNAALIHRNLSRLKMPERDAFWSVSINSVSSDEPHPIDRLIDWSLHGQTERVGRETQWLCALVLAWSFASSNRLIRDRATKSLTSILLARADIFPDLVESFRGVDDPYIWERLFGPAYGACCIDPNRDRLRNYARSAAVGVFRGTRPLENPLLRDYARGIVELAVHMQVLPDEIDAALCRPPYGSIPPKFNVTEAELKKIATEAGDTVILSSCGSSFGDFGRYEIEAHVRHFIAVKHTRPAPYSRKERFDRFEREVVGTDPIRVAALQNLRSATSRLSLEKVAAQSVSNRSNSVEMSGYVSTAEGDFLALLHPDERPRYRSEARAWLGIGAERKESEPKRFDLKAVNRWVARRAYDLGWTKELFPLDGRRYLDYSRERPLVERIGKKYQWLALNELLCRLADNYWIGGLYGDSTKMYDNPLDIGFVRDIDPTVLPELNGANSGQGTLDRWILGPEIIVPECAEDQLRQWPFAMDPAISLPNLIHRVDLQGRNWIALYDHRSVTTRYDINPVPLHGFRQQEFRFVFCVLVQQANTRRLIDEIKGKRKIDGRSWDPPEQIDGPYLLEVPWRRSVPQEQWQEDGWIVPRGLPIAFPVWEYLWESHLDASLPRGARAFVLPPWLSSQLGLSPDRTDASIYRDEQGKYRFIGAKLEPDGSSALIDADLFEAFLNRQLLDPVWIFLAERNAWPGDHNEEATWRRSEGLCWNDRGRIVAETWYEDRNSRTSLGQSRIRRRRA